MNDSAWTSVTARLFVFSVLPVLLATLHVRLDAGARGRLRTAEVYLIYLFLLGVAAGGLSGFFGHVFTADTVAESIGWPKDNPFQQEMGFANLTLGVLGLIAAMRPDREAASSPILFEHPRERHPKPGKAEAYARCGRA